MEELLRANKRLKTVADDYERDFQAIITQLDREQTALTERLDGLKQKKLETAQANGDVDADDDDLIEVNAGGKIISAKRSTLTQLKGSRLEALFSGRWDKKLQRDGNGRIFLDINPVGFRAIVDYLNEMMISSEDNPPTPPSVDDEHKHILRHQLELFGLSMTKVADSNTIKTVEEENRLHDWLEADGSDGDFSLIYRGSRDGQSNSHFHSKCNNRGCTLTIIETTDGFVFGGYSNVPWTNSGSYHAANKAFLFLLSGNENGVVSPGKMKLKNTFDTAAVYHSSSHGPMFGGGDHCDMLVEGSNIILRLGHSYEPGPPGQLTDSTGRATLKIKEMEVYQVSGTSSWAKVTIAKEHQTLRETPTFEPATRFSTDVNKAISEKREHIFHAESEIIFLEDRFKDEHNLITAFDCGEMKDVVVLNVSGTRMTTKRSTLCSAEDSALAQQFDDTKWTDQGIDNPRVDEWTTDDVSAWAKSIHGIQEDVGTILSENKIIGCELIALNTEALKTLGVERAGTQCLLLKEIKKLEKASQDIVTLIEHSPYCFGKILDYLRLKQLHSQGLIEEPALIKVTASQQSRFEKVVKYYFPGDSAKFLLG